MVLPAVLHPDVVDFLTLDKDINLKEDIGYSIFKLRQQQFDGGLRVKKLKGIAKKIWEARVTGASRLIFTYEKSRQPDTGKHQTYIAVQDLCLDHDDVSRCAKARKRTIDAEWLDAEEIWVIGSVLCDRSELTANELFALEAAQAEDLQLSDECVDELLGNIQWRVVESEEQWQRAIIQQDSDLPLKLTPEEYELVGLYGNLLLSGGAGTGKTTVGLYRLLKSLETLPTGKRLYVAYNPILVKEAHRHFQRLCGARATEIQTVFQFKTIRDLCSEIVESAGYVYNLLDEVDYQVFEQLYRRPERQQYPPTLLWDEIRSIIKGSQLSVDIPLLPQKEYERLGKKKASIIPYNQRHTVYKLAEWYQKRLNQEGRFDEIDLARKVLQIIKQGRGDRYQLIVCDEVQDFTELQLELLVKLVAPEGHLFFAGDLNQMISPSGFRWEDLKTKFFNGQRQAIQKTLKFNFRSVGSLVNLANQLVKLRSRLLKERMSDTEQPVSSYGESARLIASPVDTLQPTLEQLNPEDAILVRTEADKQRFSDEFQSSFIFTIEEAKGLEFDTVFLVEFFRDNQKLWNKVLGGKQALKETEIPQLRLELNLLYVAVTRARRILNIWETQLSQVWSQAELASFLQPINVEAVREQRIEATPQKWRDRGMYYLDAGFYRQAIECFEKVSETALRQETLAKLLSQERKYVEAAEVFMELQDWEKAAQFFEKGQQWEQAIECWRRFGDSEKQQICEIYVLESAHQWEEAAQRWEKFGKFEDAKQCWLKTNNDQKIAEIRAIEFEKTGAWIKAAQQYELGGMLKKAAECKGKEYEKHKQWELAAEQFDLAEIPEKAEDCRNQIRPTNRILHFPADKSVGTLSISNKGGWTQNDIWKPIGQARGDVSVPFHKPVKLDVNQEDLSDFSFFETLQPDDLYTVLNLKNIDNAGLIHLSRLAGLHSLDLRSSKVTDAGLVHLQNLTSLIALGLSETNVGDEGMKYLQCLHNLTRLFLSQTQISNQGLSYLQGLVKLEDLSLLNTSINDSGLKYLYNMRNLERLILIGTQVSEIGWKKLQKSLPNCEIAWMSDELLFLEGTPKRV
ncbi:MAG: 3'-5' exonuclease [Scytonema sp. PMC 1069.18]|nr:3'-5' exonuclease [Scytonema sp. PMC 1069.18]MEC4883572.1 3'-5' exonuclease [Scytonema sp. PMC 1070.18]